MTSRRGSATSTGSPHSCSADRLSNWPSRFVGSRLKSCPQRPQCEHERSLGQSRPRSPRSSFRTLCAVEAATQVLADSCEGPRRLCHAPQPLHHRRGPARLPVGLADRSAIDSPAAHRLAHVGYSIWRPAVRPSTSAQSPKRQRARPPGAGTRPTRRHQPAGCPSTDERGPRS
jgi:hypothetical protein